jgi:integrase
MSVFRRKYKDKKGKTRYTKTWNYDFWEEGRRYQGSIPKARVKAQAVRAEIKIRDSIFDGAYRKAPKVPLFTEFVRKTYLPSVRENKESWKHDEFRAEPLIKFFAKKRFSDITPLLVISYINQRLKSTTVRKDVLEDGQKENRRRSPTTVYKEVALLSAIFNMAIDEEVALKNPCRRLPKSVREKIPARNRRERFLSVEEEEQLFNLGLVGRRKHLRPLITLALNTGVRRGGLLALKKEHINLNAQSTFYTAQVKGGEMRFEIKPNHLLVVKNKGGKPYQIPLNEVAREVMEELLKQAKSDYLFFNEQTGKPIQDIKTAFTGACRAAGLKELTFHDLRHCFATRLKEAHVDPVTRRDLLGHATTEMTDSYTHSYTQTKQAAVNALVKVMGVPTKVPTDELRRPEIVAVNA